MHLGTDKIKRKVFDKQTQTYKYEYVNPSDLPSHVVNQTMFRDVGDLATYLGFPTTQKVMVYDSNDFFGTRDIKDLYDQDSIEGVRDVVTHIMEGLSVGQIRDDYIIDLGIGVDYQRLAFLMLKYAFERGLEVSPLLTAFDCQNMVLNYRGVKDSTGRDMIANFSTDFAVVIINGGTPVTYLQTFYFERLKRGKRTIFFLQNRDSLRLVLRELCRTKWLPEGAIYLGLQTKREVNIFDTIKRDVLRYSQSAHPELSFMTDIDTPSVHNLPVSKDNLELQGLIPKENNTKDEEDKFDLFAGTNFR